MRSDRFDQVTRRFAQRRLSRRTALRSSAAGIAITALGAAPLAAAAQAQDEEAASVSFLYTQTFTGGTWEPQQDDEGIYTLTLIGAAAQTVYFSDRPARLFGLTPTQQFLDQLGFTPDNPPNAAIVAQTPEGEEDVLVIELFDPDYDEATETLTYSARILAEYDGTVLSHMAMRQTDLELATPFGQGGLFIDDGSADAFDCAASCPGAQLCVLGTAVGIPFYCACALEWGQNCGTPCSSDADCPSDLPVCALEVFETSDNKPFAKHCGVTSGLCTGIRPC